MIALMLATASFLWFLFNATFAATDFNHAFNSRHMRSKRIETNLCLGALVFLSPFIICYWIYTIILSVSLDFGIYVHEAAIIVVEFFNLIQFYIIRDRKTKNWHWKSKYPGYFVFSESYFFSVIIISQFFHIFKFTASHTKFAINCENFIILYFLYVDELDCA